jgi:hypothetical protein
LAASGTRQKQHIEQKMNLIIRLDILKQLGGLNDIHVSPTNFLNFLPTLLLNSIFASLQLTTFGFVPKLIAHSLQNQKRLILPTHPNSYQVQYLPYKIGYLK